jgi:hypothetical protein
MRAASLVSWAGGFLLADDDDDDEAAARARGRVAKSPSSWEINLITH